METKLYDLGDKPSKAELKGEKPSDVYYSSLGIDQKQIPELEDYELGDEVHLEVVAKVTNVSQRENKPKQISLEMRKGRVLNLKEGRKKSIERGLSKKNSDELDKKRTK